MTAADVSTADRIARISRGKSATAEEPAKCSRNTGCQMQDARCQKWQKKYGRQRQTIREFLQKFAKNSYEREKFLKKDN
jgi:hypothetical protein